ncbi:MAG TPA: helix-turn-helix domain-containing protein [Kofleriaceae bacterium]|nr:helix-turn-helix domain-containing protein [Kofleriaceae bacterium]
MSRTDVAPERVFAGSDALEDTSVRVFACDERYPAPVAERVLPDGVVHLVITLGDLQRGDRNADLRCLVGGASCTPTRIVLAGDVSQVCVRLGIGTAAAVLGVPAREVTDDGVALDALWGAAAHELFERLAAAPTEAARVHIMSHALAARLRLAETPRVIYEAVRRISRAGGRVRIAALARALGIGERRLQQLFDEHVGLTPKALARLARFRAVLAACAQARPPAWTELALSHGFYDQAHFANELRELAGLTPTQLAQSEFGFLQDDVTTAEIASSHARPS